VRIDDACVHIRLEPVHGAGDEEPVQVDAMVSTPGAEPWSAAGRGKPGRVGVLVVHGFTGNPVATRPLGQRLASAGHRVEVTLLPGHGTSHHDLAGTRYADWADAVGRVLDHLASTCDRVVLVGHSLGGTIALDLASSRPDDVDGVVVINPQVSNPRHPVAKLAPVLAHLLPFVPRDLAGMPTDDLARPDVEERAYALVSSRAARSLIAQLPRIRSQLIDLIQPLLVVRSPQDHTVPAENSLELMELVGSGDVRELVCERSYHVPQLDYDAEEVEAAVVDFVAEFVPS
jgi:carboxylesterase